MNLRRFFFLFFATTILLLHISIAELPAQGSAAPNNRTSRGREFYIAFLPNVHDGGRNTPILNDSLYIYITCDVPTSGVIRYRVRNGTETTIPFAIPNPNQIYTLRVHYANVELQGYYTGDRFDSIGAQSERIARQTFHITANDDVTIYGLNQALYTSDAFLALPVSSLGTEYMILAYKSDARGLLFMPNNRDEVSTPSQFAIIATQNNTDIRILPSAPTLVSGSNAPQTIRLNAGEVYLVQADPRAAGGLADLSGSRVIASRPIAVFAGHQRTTLPVELRPSLWTRDHLVEQLPGLETWGKSAFLTPFLRARDEIGVGSDLFRIIAAYDNTRVFINGQPLTTLSSGQVYESTLISAAWITASDQILVAQYKKTSSTLDAKFVGDPFMLLVPQIEQYDRSYRFINVEAFDPSNLGVASPSSRGRVFEDHFITIIAPNRGTGLSSLVVDGIPLDASRFTPIVNSGYSFGNFGLGPGVHTARGDSAFALYVYGYGVLNSYGYIGGGRLKIIAPDRDAPVVAWNSACNSVSGVVYDTLLTDSRIASVRALSPQNVTVNIAPFTPFTDSVAFSARLQNSLQDGEFTLEARDSIGFLTRQRFFLPGFTVALEGQNALSPTQERRFSMPTGTSRTFRLPIANYGSTTQTITGFNLVNATTNAAPFRIIAPALPLTLRPQARDTIVVALDAPQDGVFSSTLALISTCATRTIAALRVEAGQDRTAPDVAVSRDVCARTITLRLRDGEPFPSGIARVEPIGDLINCTLRIESGTNANAYNLGAILTITNPNRDAIYALAVVDSAGNRTVVRDTVQGFTLEIVRARNERGGTGEWGNIPITTQDCREITVRNVGVRPYRIERLALRNNIWFSMPASQFPITIAPGGERTITTCFAPVEVRDYTDTLVLEGYCRQEALALKGSGEALVRTVTGRCNVEIRLTTTRAPLQYFMEQNYPNPTSNGFTVVHFGLPTKTNVTVSIFTLLGNEVAHVPMGELTAGEHDITLDMNGLQAGWYLYVVQTSERRMAKQLLLLP
ncbi:MAG: T9SS type A sorting domain-containing protein [Candidatus Kapaibacteriota bacterium]